MNDCDKIVTLLDLKKQLAYFKYTDLPLCHLKLLRDEVENEIQYILNKDKKDDVN